MPKIKLNPDKLVGYTRTDFDQERCSQARNCQARLQARDPPNKEAPRHAR